MTNPIHDIGRPLNILVISSLLPYPPNTGGITRLFNLYSRLGQKHCVTWASPIWQGTEQYVSEAEKFCLRVVGLSLNDAKPFPDSGWHRLLFRAVARLRWERMFVFCYGYVQAPGLYWLPASPERLATIRQLVTDSHFDLIVSEFEGTAELLPDGSDIPSVIVLHNSLSTLFRRIRKTYVTSRQNRLFFWPELLKIMAYERRQYSRYSLGITVSAQDQYMLKRRCPHLPSVLLPNGVDVTVFQPAPPTSTSTHLIFVGHYGYPPNADAILYFCHEILPLIRQQIPSVELWAVGHEPPAELFQYVDQGVRVSGTVPDVRPYMAQADVMVVPLRVGGGTRLKILEGMAMAKAIVSTTLGAEGLSTVHGRDILMADRPTEFADGVVRLLRDPAMRACLGREGRKLVEQEYDWGGITARLDSVYQSVVQNHKHALAE